MSFTWRDLTPTSQCESSWSSPWYCCNNGPPPSNWPGHKNTSDLFSFGNKSLVRVLIFRCLLGMWFSFTQSHGEAKLKKNLLNNMISTYFKKDIGSNYPFYVHFQAGTRKIIIFAITLYCIQSCLVITEPGQTTVSPILKLSLYQFAQQRVDC